MLFSSVALFSVNLIAEGGTPDLEIDSYDDLVAFLANVTAGETYENKTVALTENITVNEGWTVNDGQAAATAAPTGENAKILTGTTGIFKGTLEENLQACTLANCQE